MDQNPQNGEEQQDKEKEETGKKQVTSKYVRMRLFPFIMLLFGFVFVTALVTTIVMSLGDDKQVKVSIPERKEFTKLYNAYDTIKKNYYKKNGLG